MKQKTVITFLMNTLPLLGLIWHNQLVAQCSDRFGEASGITYWALGAYLLHGFGALILILVSLHWNTYTAFLGLSLLTISSLGHLMLSTRIQLFPKVS